MKKTLFYLFLLVIATKSFSQDTIQVYPGAGTPINDSLGVIVDMGTLSQDVILLLHNGTYNETIDITNLLTSENARVIIKSESGIADSVIINSNAGNECIRIINSFITIKNISLFGDNAGVTIDLSTGGQAKAFINGGSITIDSCKIQASMGNCIDVIGDSQTPMYDVGNILLSNNTFSDASNGIYINQDMSNLYNLNISNNKFENLLFSAIKFNSGFIYLYNLEILNNEIELGYSSSQGTVYGIDINHVGNDLSEGNGVTLISNNTIYRDDINDVEYIGIHVASSSATTNGFTVSNNYINIQNTDANVIGIFMDYSDSINIYHNTINVEGTNSTTFMYFGASKAYNNINLYNNILKSENVIIEADILEGLRCNYNCYYSTIVDNSFYIEGTYYNLSGWIGNTGQDINSLNEDPDLSIGFTPYYNNQSLDNYAPSVGIYDDIQNINRNTTFCDIGAKEQLFINLGNDTTICYGDSIILSTSIGMYSYAWSNGQIDTNSIYTGLPDTYSVTVQEIDGGAFGIDTIFVNKYTEIISTIEDYQIPKCFGENTGYLELTTTGGTLPYSYNWQGTFLDTNKIENLIAGDYYVTITDVNNCAEVNLFILDEPDEIIASFSSDIFCGGCVGQIDVDATGGYSPYNYTWSTGNVNQTISDLCSGVYTVTVIDDSLCIKTFDYEITESELAYISGNLGFSLGNVFSGHARVELYKDSLNGASEIEFIDSVTVGTNGYFEFSEVNPEAFYLRGIITSGNTIYNDLYTSYYSNNVPTTLWESATLITLSCADTIDNINFDMFEVTSPVTGPGIFSGGISYNGLAKLAGEPVPGAEVFVEQEPNDEPIANTVTDTLGNWDISNIPVGTGYKLKVDIPGLPQLSSYQGLEVTGTKSIISNLNFFVDTLTGGGIFVDTTTAIINLGSENIEIKTYPNPVINYLIIETDLLNNVNVSYSIIDLNGKEIVSSDIENTIGKYNETIDMSSYQPGTYFIKLRLDNTFYVRKFIKE